MKKHCFKSLSRIVILVCLSVLFFLYFGNDLISTPFQVVGQIEDNYAVNPLQLDSVQFNRGVELKHSTERDKPIEYLDNDHTVDSTRQQVDRGKNTRAPVVAGTCTQEERLSRLYGACGGQPPDGTELDSISDKQLLDMISGSLIVVDRFRTLACVQYKAASTTQLTVMVNNTRQHALPANTSWTLQQLWKQLKPAGVRFLGSYRDNMTHVRHVLRSYYKYMIVRHPLDRVHSTWWDKYVYAMSASNASDWWRTVMTPQVLRLVRPDLNGTAPTLEIRLNFSDVFRYALAGGHNLDPHLTSDLATRRCLACLVPYHYVGKVETLDQDLDHVITHRFTPQRGKSTHVHQHHEAKPTSKMRLPFRKKLEDAQNLTGRQMDEFETIYQQDLRDFGYRIEREGNEYYSVCDGNCC